MHIFHQYLPAWVLIGLVSLSQLVIPAAWGQTDISGVIDLDAQKRHQIAVIQARLNADLDLAAERQVVLLQWLIELLESTGELDRVRNCYEKILSFYPNDVRTLNDYGEFLFETAGDTVMAQKILRDAAQYSRLINTPARLTGRTYFLLGKLHHLRADHARAVEFFETARLYLGSEVPEPHLRLLGLSFAQLGQYDQAVQTWLELIGQQKGLNNDDIESFKQIHRLAGRYRDQAPDELIDLAVSNYMDRRRRELQGQGAELVSFPASDGYLLTGSRYSSAGSQAVLFVSELGQSQSDWRVYAQLLFVTGITNLAFDLRGHGDSRSRSIPAVEHLTAGDLSRFAGDIKSALSFLDSTAGRIFNQRAIVAVGTGCGWVELALHNQPETTGVLYISPLFDTEDQELAHAIAFRRDRPTLIIYSTEDVLAAASCRSLAETKPFQHLEIIRLSQAGHGLEALNQDLTATGQFEKWIHKVLPPADSINPAK
jgi:pimeloyl-ACP methyl ester carboxylesterase/Tfp pilus assembly protein PilF